MHWCWASFLAEIDLSATVLYFFPRKNLDVVVICFGLLTLLYGTRFTSGNANHAAPHGYFAHDMGSSDIRDCLSDSCPVPGFSSLIRLAKDGRRLALWVFRLQVGLASLVIIVELNSRRLGPSECLIECAS